MSSSKKMGTKYVDLRSSRRLTLVEASVVLELLREHRPKLGAVRKLEKAIELLTHECRPHPKWPGQCEVCSAAIGMRRYQNPPPRPPKRLEGPLRFPSVLT